MHFKGFWAAYKELDRTSCSFMRRYFVPYTLLEYVIICGMMFVFGGLKLNEIPEYIEYIKIRLETVFEVIKEKFSNL